MPDHAYKLDGFRIFECAPEGPALRHGRDATDLIGAAWREQAVLVAIPAARLGDDFFVLKTGIAGEVLQKFVTYRMRVVITGDISRHLGESPALADFVRECNRGPNIWFVPDVRTAAEWLRGGPGLAE